MIVRYRYRAYPTPDQQHLLARAFGCARVVYNDAIAVRQQARAAGEKISDTEVQRRVITEAKGTPEREWLSEVSSVVLVQSCQDARRAFRNFFDSRSGKRKGRKVGAPGVKTRRDHRQSLRFTRNGFTVTELGVRLARIGDVEVRWSRELPSPPSPVTVIREADGRSYVSFVVEREEQLLPEAGTVAGVDLGLDSLVTIVRSDGSREKIAPPKPYRAAERRLGIAQKSLSRKEKGSKNREKARVRVAVLHRKVREQRLDHHHKLSLRLVRENHTVAVETLSVAGLARTNKAKSVHDAAWSTLVRLLGEKAAHHGGRSSGSTGGARPHRPARSAGWWAGRNRCTSVPGRVAAAPGWTGTTTPP